MNVACVWEHNGNDTLLYAANFPGAYTRGASLQEAMEKMPAEIRSYLNWKGEDLPENVHMTVVQDAACSLNIADADSDVLFFSEKAPLPREEYVVLKNLALKSAADFLALYQAIPDQTASTAPMRTTFYGQVPRTAEEMYQHIVTREVCRFARNTVDTLALTRELRSYGVEVYFVSDNIWTMDGDGELRLAIMATLAQEESRKISERVRAGQAISRENGVLYGTGNIIGYNRVNGTYVIDPEQAQTVRTVYQLYAQGLGQRDIVNELTRLGYKDGNGNVKWSCIKISRILRNQTYMGYICYNKSWVNNFLEKKRVKDFDEDTFILKKGDFEPIISEELWHQCDRIRKSRIREYRLPSGEERRRGIRFPQHLWVKKLCCRCGAGFHRYRWRVLRDGTPVYGYQCMKRTHGPAKSYLEKHEIQGQAICEAISVCQWKLELMAKRIFDQIWGDQGKAVAKACQMLESCMYAAGVPFGSAREGLQRQMDKLEKRMLSLGQMRADGELTREQYQNLYAQAAAEREKIQGQLEHASAEGGRAPKLDLTQIKKKLAQVVDVSTPKISDELVEEFVEVVTPVEDYHYRWKLNFGEIQERGRYDLLHPESPPVLSFTIDFEMARQYRKENELPPQFRRSSWNDLFVEVYL